MACVSGQVRNLFSVVLGLDPRAGCAGSDEWKIRKDGFARDVLVRAADNPIPGVKPEDDGLK
jgi:hypothetical protein